MTINGDCKLLSVGRTQSVLFWRGGGMGGSGQEEGKVPRDGQRSCTTALRHCCLPAYNR